MSYESCLTGYLIHSKYSKGIDNIPIDSNHLISC